MKRFSILALILALILAIPALGAAQAEEGILALPEPTVGGLTIFGRYEQDNHADNGPENIMWVVLELDDEKMVSGLEVAGLIGNLIKKNASVSGAQCGCQAEVGAACSMAAAGLDYLFGLSTNQIQYAAEIALEHHLGLTCDPILGLVQVPCIERNAVAATRAMNACNLSYFLTETQRISFDMAVRTMYETGISMNKRFLETSEGGLAKMYGRRNEH